MKNLKENQKVKLWFDSGTETTQYREGIVKGVEDGVLTLETKEEITKYVEPKYPKGYDGEAWAGDYVGTGKFKITIEHIPLLRIFRILEVEA